MKLTYGVSDKPAFGKVLIFAFQQLLAILAATIAVPAIVGNGMSTSAALFGAGIGTIVYLLFTKFKSPVFLGSSVATLMPVLIPASIMIGFVLKYFITQLVSECITFGTTLAIITSVIASIARLLSLKIFLMDVPYSSLSSII